ncbi:HAD domain-containing protein [Azonexus hydrophilus]|uniref:HAD domain-containing protein n=1 Tax=Azonexus hydrophilus TaxID=418702 RepID=UPI001F06AE1A|nr:HAD domain-containing protein [Azonexus hydrophilus]
MILFLDFDGVLHPDAVYFVRGRPTLRAKGELFMWAGALVDLLTEHPDVRIVLSTSWVRALRFNRARSYLPAELRRCVIGATWHSAMSVDEDMRPLARNVVGPSDALSTNPALRGSRPARSLDRHRRRCAWLGGCRP